MRIVIYGVSKVGISIAETLSVKKHEITIVGDDQKKINELQKNLDVLCVRRNIGDIDIVEEANIKDADVFIAVSTSDEENIVACLIAKRQNVDKIIARIRNPAYLDKKILDTFDMGIDHIIQSEKELAKEIVRLIRNPWASDIEAFLDEQVILVEVKVHEDNLKYLHKKLKVLSDNDLNIIVESGSGKEHLSMFDKRKKLHLDDNIFVLERKSDVMQINKIFEDVYAKIQSVMILGGGVTGEELLGLLQKTKLDIKLIEKNRARCQRLSKKAKKSIILCGDGTDLDLLMSENISETDCFIAITGDDENNIMTSLFAKQKGVKKAITNVSKAYEEGIIDKVGLDATVNVNKVTVNEILKFVRKKDLVKTSILNADVEILEFYVQNNPKIIKKPLKDAQFTSRAIIGAVYRDDELFFPKKNFNIKDGDMVLVFAHKDVIPAVEKYFKPKK